MTARRNYSNTATPTYTTTAMTASSTSLSVASVSGYPAAPFTIVVHDEAILVDTSKYGYFAEWEPMNVESYREDSNDQWVYKLNAHNGFAVTDAQAAVKIQGGASGA